MIKGIIAAVCLLLGAAASVIGVSAEVTAGVSAQGRTELNDPEQVSVNADLPRSAIKSYNKREYSLRQLADSSSYIQPLAGAWKIKTFSDVSQVDNAFVLPESATDSWTDVTVPETKTQTAAAAIYRRDFKFPLAWIDREVFVHIGAVSRAYYVYINGKLAGYHEDSKTGRDFNITKLVEDGKNRIAVMAYASPVSATLENQIKEQGCAIEGDLYVFTQPRIRIRDYVIDTQFDPTGTDGLFNFGAILKSHLLNTKDVTVYYELIDPDGNIVTSGKRDSQFKLRNEDTVRFFANVPNVKAWNHESPMLYTVTMKLQHEGRYTEYAAVKIGFRTVGMADKGLLINGHRFDIHAVDYEPARDTAALKRELADLKDKGVNLIRVGNFPQPDLFYDMCDQYGFYVCNKANIDAGLSGESLKIGGTPANDPKWQTAYTDRVMNMYFISKNHPSVVMFSLGKQGGRGINMYEAYLALKEQEKSRPVIYGDAGAEWNTDIVVGGSPMKRNPTDVRPSIVFHKASDVKKIVPPESLISIGGANIQRGEITIENKHSIANVNNFRTVYRIKQRNKIISEGKLTANVAAGKKETVTVPIEGLKPGTYTVEIVIERAPASDKTGGDKIISQNSFQLVVPKQ